jgi:hypothetical protein
VEGRPIKPGSRSRRLSLAATLALIGGTAAIASDSAAAAPAPQRITIYSIATQEQFLNHKDDRSRGTGNNPFGNFKDTSTPSAQGGVGPFVGDRAIFTFRLFADPGLKRSIGSAIYVCHYSFDKESFCNADYILADGTLTGAGEFNFSASKFALAVTGGTGKYRSTTGDLFVSPAANHSQRVLFTFPARKQP